MSSRCDMFGMVGHRAAHAQIRALNGEGSHFFSLARIKIMNLGCLEALESMLTNMSSNWSCKQTRTQGSVGLRAVWLEHDIL